MSFIDALLGYNKENTGLRFDIGSWKNLEFNDICGVISKALIEYRSNYGLTQKGLADMLGCSKGYIIKLETGQIDDISMRELIEIWTKLSREDLNFGDYLLTGIKNIVDNNYKQLSIRRWGK